MDTLEEFENLVRDKYLVDGEMILGKYNLFFTTSEKSTKVSKVIITNRRIFAWNI